MKNKSILLFLPIIILISWFACGTNKTKSPAYTQAIYWNESIEDLQSHLSKKIEVLAEENQELLELATKNPAPDVLEQLKRHETIIAQYRGIVSKHENIIETHNEYLEQQTSSALTVNEIRAQNQTIHQNLITVQNDVTQISEEINAFLSMYDKLEEELDT